MYAINQGFDYVENIIKDGGVFLPFITVDNSEEEMKHPYDEDVEFISVVYKKENNLKAAIEKARNHIQVELIEKKKIDPIRIGLFYDGVLVIEGVKKNIVVAEHIGKNDKYYQIYNKRKYIGPLEKYIDEEKDD